MNRSAGHILVNYLGQGSQFILLFASLPVFLNYLGPDAFGLIGVYTLMQAWFNLLDLGLSPMLSRAFAQHENNDYGNQRIINLLRSVEIVLIVLSLIMVFSSFLFSDTLVKKWLTTDAFTRQELSNILKIFFVMFSLRLFESIYKSSLIGMQEHIKLNITFTFLTFVKTATSILVIIFLTNNVETFFYVQLSFGAFSAISLLYLTYKLLPVSMWYGQFSLTSLKEVYKFSIGLAGITLLSLSLTHLDKIILISYISLENFGYYTLAASVAGSLQLLVTPISLSLGPKLATQQKKNNIEDFQKTFLFGAELIAIITCTVGSLIIFFSSELLTIWTGNTEFSDKTYQVCALLTFGNILNVMMWMPLQAQMAYAWTRLMLMTNLVSIIILVPFNLIFIPIHGAYASATIWLILNAGYVLVGSYLMFSRILPNTNKIWLWRCVARPLLLGMSVPFFAKILFVFSENAVIFIIQLTSLALISATVITLSSVSLRKKLSDLSKRI